MRKNPTRPSLAALTLLAACSAAPPQEDFIAPSRAELETALSAGAEEHAPVDLRFAREKLAAAEAAMADGEYGQARYLAAQSKIDSEVAAAKAEAAIARRESRNLERRNRDMRSELDGDGRP